MFRKIKQVREKYYFLLTIDGTKYVLTELLFMKDGGEMTLKVQVHTTLRFVIN